jgi:hypothetical protein
VEKEIGVSADLGDGLDAFVVLKNAFENFVPGGGRHRGNFASLPRVDQLFLRL